MSRAIALGLETWNIDLQFTPTGVSLLRCENTTAYML